ncbi:MAG: GspH/FimT family pseudopilin [Wenzhouxiangella sp.]|nr:GspH/FimT family pseudopilin [Wenzhouxiangella sp.]
MKAQSGWSLIELIIGLSILAILSSIAAPGMQGFIEQQRIINASNQLVTHLNYARNEAVTRATFVSACPSPNGLRCSGNRWDQGFIAFVDAERSGQPAGESDLLRVVQPDPRMLMHSGGRYRVRFQPMGGAYGTNLTIRVCSKNGRGTPNSVIVSNPGRPRVSREEVGLDCQP